MNVKNYIYEHTTPETAYVVQDYPWGFRLRTTIRYWIESKATKNGGQRFASQTINPKTGKWCAPKYSTYSEILVMYLDENNHVKIDGLHYNSDECYINIFKDTHMSNFDEFQKEQLRKLLAYCKVMKHVKWEIKLPSVSCEDNDIQQAEIKNKINYHIQSEYQRNKELIK